MSSPPPPCSGGCTLSVRGLDGARDAGEDSAREDGGGATRDAGPRDVGPPGLDAALATDAGPGGVDAGPTGDDAGPAGDDAGPAGDDGGAGCVLRRWRADFGADPTSQDLNGDGMNDWRIRAGGAFPVDQLSGGVWRAPTGSGALDTVPNHGFNGRVRASVRMRSTDTGGNGATMWVNVDYSATSFAPVYVQLRRQGDGTQTLTLHGKTSNPVTLALATVSGLGGGMVEVDLDIDTALNLVTLTVDGVVRGTFTYFTYGPPNTDRFGTVITWSSGAEFDWVEISDCE